MTIIMVITMTMTIIIISGPAVAGPEVTSEVQAGEKKKDQVEKHTLNNFLLIFVSCRVIRVATVKRGEVLKTRPGSFPCRALLHVCGQKDAGVTEKLVHRIVQLCNTSGYKSVAIPAICTGKCCATRPKQSSV